MTDPEHTPNLDEAEARMFEELANDVRALPARLARARQLAQETDDKARERWAANRAELAGHKAAIEELSERQRAEHEARKKELAAQRAELAEREKALAEDRARVIERERWVEHKAQDLNNRIRGAARCPTCPTTSPPPTTLPSRPNAYRCRRSIRSRWQMIRRPMSPPRRKLWTIG